MYLFEALCLAVDLFLDSFQHLEVAAQLGDIELALVYLLEEGVDLVEVTREGFVLLFVFGF